MAWKKIYWLVEALEGNSGRNRRTSRPRIFWPSSSNLSNRPLYTLARCENSNAQIADSRYEKKAKTGKNVKL